MESIVTPLYYQAKRHINRFPPNLTRADFPTQIKQYYRNHAIRMIAPLAVADDAQEQKKKKQYYWDGTLTDLTWGALATFREMGDASKISGVSIYVFAECRYIYIFH